MTCAHRSLCPLNCFSQSTLFLVRSFDRLLRLLGKSLNAYHEVFYEIDGTPFSKREWGTYAVMAHRARDGEVSGNWSDMLKDLR